MFGAPDLFYTYLVGARIAPPGSASQLIEDKDVRFAPGWQPSE